MAHSGIGMAFCDLGRVPRQQRMLRSRLPGCCHTASRYGREVQNDGIGIPEAAKAADQHVWSERARATLMRTLQQGALPSRAVITSAGRKNEAKRAMDGFEQRHGVLGSLSRPVRGDRGR